MSAEDPLPLEEERDLLAAEYALGLLEGGELVAARQLAASDAGFAAAVAAWEERLMPLADDAPAVIPGPAVWDGVRRAIAEAQGAGENVVQLRRRINVWRGVAGAAMAIAASLALVVGLDRAKEEPPVVAERLPERAPVMVASLASPERETSLSVAYDAADRSLHVMPGRMTGAAGHDHELWIIPAGGAPVSLGVVRAGRPQRLPVPARMAVYFRAEAAVALTVEPVGGSPTGHPTGPVVASGALVTI